MPTRDWEIPFSSRAMCRCWRRAARASFWSSQDALHPLLSGLPGVSQCLPISAGTLPAFDMHCPMCSLPLAFGTRLDTIPSGDIVSAALRARAACRPGKTASARTTGCGSAWSGPAIRTHRNDHNRSIPLRTLSRILDVDATFVSLQKDPRPDDQAVLARAHRHRRSDRRSHRFQRDGGAGVAASIS